MCVRRVVMQDAVVRRGANPLYPGTRRGILNVVLFGGNAVIMFIVGHTRRLKLRNLWYSVCKRGISKVKEIHPKF